MNTPSSDAGASSIERVRRSQCYPASRLPPSLPRGSMWLEGEVVHDSRWGFDPGWRGEVCEEKGGRRVRAPGITRRKHFRSSPGTSARGAALWRRRLSRSIMARAAAATRVPHRCHPRTASRDGARRIIVRVNTNLHWHWKAARQQCSAAAIRLTKTRYALAKRGVRVGGGRSAGPEPPRVARSGPWAGGVVKSCNRINGFLFLSPFDPLSAEARPS